SPHESNDSVASRSMPHQLPPGSCSPVMISSQRSRWISVDDSRCGLIFGAAVLKHRARSSARAPTYAVAGAGLAGEPGLFLDPPALGSIKRADQRGVSRVCPQTLPSRRVPGSQPVDQRERQPKALEVRKRHQPRTPPDIPYLSVWPVDHAGERRRASLNVQHETLRGPMEVCAQIVKRSERPPA